MGDLRRAPKGSRKYVDGRYTTTRLSRDTYGKLKAYAVEHGTSISEVIEEILREYVEDARKRLLNGKPIQGKLRDTTKVGKVFVVSWHGDEKLTRDLHQLVALDGTTIRKVVEEGIERKLAGFTPSALMSEEGGEADLEHGHRVDDPTGASE
jgi:hypothetical protein